MRIKLTRSNCRSAAISCFSMAFLSCSEAAEVSTAPPFLADEQTIPHEKSVISITAGVPLATVMRMAGEEIPQRIATINENRKSCLKQKLLGVRLKLACRLTGEITRSGPLTLQPGKDGHFSLSLPVHARLLGRVPDIDLAQTTEADATIIVEALPAITPDYAMTLGIKPDFRWTKKPKICVIDGDACISLAPLVEPLFQKELRKAAQKIEAQAAKLDLRKQVEKLWQKIASPVKLAGNPEIWLTATPERIGFSEVTLTNENVSAQIQVTAELQAKLGEKPQAEEPRLPPLESAPRDESGFDITVPFTVDYKSLAAEIAGKLQKGRAWSPESGMAGMMLTVNDVAVYPSGKQLVVRISAAVDAPGTTLDTDGVAYLAATPVIDNAARKVSFDDIALTATTSNVATNGLLTLFALPSLRKKLSEAATLSYATQYEDLLEKAGTALSRDLGEGFESRARFESLIISGIVLGKEAARLDLKAHGKVEITTR